MWPQIIGRSIGFLSEAAITPVGSQEQIKNLRVVVSQLGVRKSTTTMLWLQHDRFLQQNINLELIISVQYVVVTIQRKCFTDQDGAEPSGNSVSCHNLQRLAVYADKSAAADGGKEEREMAKKLLIAFSKRLIDTPTALPEMMSALMFYTDSPTQVCLE